MKIEQLDALKEMFSQLEKLKRFLKLYEKDRLMIVASIDGFTISDDILNKIVKKYTKNVVEDLKEEIKKRETELESISIVKLNKLV